MSAARLVLCAILACVAGVCLPQKVSVDSLWSVWHDRAAGDASRLKALFELFDANAIEFHPDTVAAYAAMELSLARKLKDPVSEADAWLNMGIGHFVGGVVAPADSCLAKALELLDTRDHSRTRSEVFMYMGSQSLRKGDPGEALTHFDHALELCKSIEAPTLELWILFNKANVLQARGDIAGSIATYTTTLARCEQLNDSMVMGTCLLNIGTCYELTGEGERAKDQYARAVEVLAAIDDVTNLPIALCNLGDLNLAGGEVNQALDRYDRAHTIALATGHQYNLCLSLVKIGTAQLRLEQFDAAKASFQEAIRVAEGSQITEILPLAVHGMARLHMAKKNYRIALPFAQRALALARAQGDVALIGDIAKDLYTSYRDLGRFQEALEMHELTMTMRDSLIRVENQREVMSQRFRYEYEKKEALLTAEQEKRNAVAAEEIRLKNLQRNAFIGGFGLMLLLAATFFVQRNRVNKARKRSDELLLNILPEEVADELKAKGEAEAKHFDSATILFSDFKGFTEASEKLTPQELVEELNVCFKAFDHITAARGIEKIKTIGDAYMCAGGLPDPKSSSPSDVVQAALEMQAFMKARKVERDALGKPAFEMRVGIHTGPVVAGIVGVKKFQYDIWGDTVNTASRMESSGAVGEVNISEATYQLVKDEPGFTFAPRGKVQAKGKGELEMYFVEGKPAVAKGNGG